MESGRGEEQSRAKTRGEIFLSSLRRRCRLFYRAFFPWLAASRSTDSVGQNCSQLASYAY